MRPRFTQPAEDQLATVLEESARAHGLTAADRYAALIEAAVAAIGADPRLLGAAEVGGTAGVWTYPIRLSRRWVPAYQRVRSPRHLVLYRVTGDGVIEVIGLVHERMLVARAARRAVREAKWG